MIHLSLLLMLLSAASVVGLGVSGSNNWAVIVSTSRYWFNYRHMSNALSLYHTVRQFGIPDEQIILMLPDSLPCSSRNSDDVGSMYNSVGRELNLYGADVVVDYRGEDVTVESVLRVLTNRMAHSAPRSKRLLSDDASNILVYLSGHGGLEFLKFQDAEELAAADIAAALQQMHVQRRYRHVLLIIDTCQAASLFNAISAPNVIGIASSRSGQNSYSYTTDDQLGFALIDRFTYETLDFFRRHRHVSNISVRALVGAFDSRRLLSDVVVTATTEHTNADNALVTDFFAAKNTITTTRTRFPLRRKRH